MSVIGDALNSVRSGLPEDVTLVAVSKYHPVEDLMEAYSEGQRDFGENIVQELRDKQAGLPADIRWHFIGHLQTNKVKYIVPFVSLIHSVDSLKLLLEINRQGQRVGRTVDCLLQIHVAAETTKFGFFPRECVAMLRDLDLASVQHVRLRGIMCMATNTPDVERVRRDFCEAQSFFAELKRSFFAGSGSFNVRSYGMSGDYPVALQSGSNMVRVGTRIFGPRKY